MVAKVLPLEVPRAKALRRSDSGVFRLHAADNAPESADAKGLDPSPAQPRSERRATLRRALMALVRGAMTADGVSYADAGAACDRPKQHIGEMLACERAMTAEDLISIGLLSPSVQKAVNDYWMRGR